MTLRLTIECDNCQNHVVLTERDRLPEGWARIDITTADATVVNSVHFCPKCCEIHINPKDKP